jgi:hypothetical protein
MNKYIATIPNEHRDQFDVALNKISLDSEVLSGHRLHTIIPCNHVTHYEVTLTSEEMLMMMLSAPGEYRCHTIDKMWKLMKEYLSEMKT